MSTKLLHRNVYQVIDLGPQDPRCATKQAWIGREVKLAYPKVAVYSKEGYVGGVFEDADTGEEIIFHQAILLPLQEVTKPPVNRIKRFSYKNQNYLETSPQSYRSLSR